MAVSVGRMFVLANRRRACLSILQCHDRPKPGVSTLTVAENFSPLRRSCHHVACCNANAYSTITKRVGVMRRYGFGLAKATTAAFYSQHMTETTVSPVAANLRRLVDGTDNEQRAKELEEELLKGSRAALALAITLVESTNTHKRAIGDLVLHSLLRRNQELVRRNGAKGLPFRIGVSGAPGVGKSSFIESFGKLLVEQYDKRLAVLTVDPSSHSTGGSILGDMSRMTELSRDARCYIRQSPTRGALGGVTRGTQEAITLCEGAGYDVVLVETVGVGQSEIAVAGMVDLFCLLISPTHGDELQAVKRGVMELSDLILVTKADGDLVPRANMTKADHISSLKYMRPRSKNWKTKVSCVSSLTGAGLEDAWKSMADFRQKLLASGELMERRMDQSLQSMWQHLEDGFVAQLKSADAASLQPLIPKLEFKILRGDITPGKAADVLMDSFFKKPVDK